MKGVRGNDTKFTFNDDIFTASGGSGGSHINGSNGGGCSVSFESENFESNKYDIISYKGEKGGDERLLTTDDKDKHGGSGGYSGSFNTSIIDKGVIVSISHNYTEKPGKGGYWSDDEIYWTYNGEDGSGYGNGRGGGRPDKNGKFRIEGAGSEGLALITLIG